MQIEERTFTNANQEWNLTTSPTVGGTVDKECSLLLKLIVPL